MLTPISSLASRMEKYGALAALCSICLATPSLAAATYYVSTSGSDSNPGSASQPFRTIQRGLDAATGNGDVVSISAGDYGEYATTKAAGVTIQASSQPVRLQALRVNQHSHVTVDGLGFARHSARNTWGAMIRVEANSDYLTVRRCTFRDTPLLISDGWSFNNSDNSISAIGVDWMGAGFEVGSHIYTGGSSLTDNTYQNLGSHLTITGFASTNKAFVSPALAPETATSIWAPIFPSVGDQYGIRAIRLFPSGGVAASHVFIHDNLVSNIYGAAFVLSSGSTGNVISNNTVWNTRSCAWAHLYGNNITVVSNFVSSSTNWVFYATESAHHPAGGSQYYDYIQGHFHTVGPGTNVVVRGNWLQNIDQPIAQISETPSSTNWLWEGNVFVGFARNFGCGVNGTTFRNNTFYRCAYDVGFGNPLTVGGNSVDSPVTNMWIYRNAFIDCGSHESTNNEAGFGLINSVKSGWYSNFVAGPETTAWQGKRTYFPTNGVNGGNPRMADSDDPLGPDRLPFTADDGLRPLPGSPLALRSIGALTPVKPKAATPIANFSLQPKSPGWYDQTGWDYDPSYLQLLPWERTNVIRHWTTPEPLGNVPCGVFMDASTSISGDFSTNSNFGIKKYVFDWGDGSVVESWTPTNSHTYLWPGEFTVTVTVENNAGNTASNSRVFRVLDVSDYTGDIFHVAKNGSDSTGNGTMASPWASIAKAVTAVSAGDYVAVHPGDYAEYVDVNRNVATPNGRIAIHGFGAAIGGMQFRYSNWTIEGFDIDNSPSGPSGVYVFQAADNILIKSCFFHDHGGFLFGAIYVVGSSTPSYNPSDQSLNGRIIGCTFSNIASPVIQIFGGSDWVVSNFRAMNTTSEGDFIRPRGRNHIIQDGYVYGLDSGGTGGHPDFLQLDNQGGNGYWFKDILVQRVFVEGNTNSTSDAQIAQIETGAFGDSVRYTNLVFRNCIFKNVRGPINDSNDGLKIYNCLFYRSPRSGGLVTTGGGIRGSSYGTRIYNNIFYGCGLTDRDNTGWYQNGTAEVVSSNTTVFADHNFVAGVTGVAKQEAPPNDVFHWAIPGQETHGINGGLPFFVNEAAGDFRLAAGSPLLNAGANLSPEFNTDYLGTVRPQGLAWDIGPFEGLGAGGSPSFPQPPSNLRILGP